eukprot:COSAG01_NODE_2414_length_7740_cov_10.011386_4_plen_455_part_00
MMMARILQVSIFLAAHARGEDCFKLLEQLCPQEASSAGDHTASGCRSCLADHARELSSCSGTQQQVYCGDGECHSKLEALCHSRPTTHKCKVSDLRKKCNSCVQLNRPELVSATATASGSWAGPTVHNGTACDDTSIQWYCGTESKSKLSKAVGYGLTVVSLICWGSWSNSAKEADKQQVPFPHFYTDYAASIFFSSIAFWVIFAKGELDVATQGNPVGHWRALAGLGAGAVFNVANVLMVHGINVAGLSIAFPLAIGTALVLGTVLIYIVDTCNRPTNAGLLFVGVGFGFVAVVMIALADRLVRGRGPGPLSCPACRPAARPPCLPACLVLCVYYLVAGGRRSPWYICCSCAVWRRVADTWALPTTHTPLLWTETPDAIFTQRLGSADQRRRCRRQGRSQPCQGRGDLLRFRRADELLATPPELRPRSGGHRLPQPLLRCAPACCCCCCCTAG